MYQKHEINVKYFKLLYQKCKINVKYYKLIKNTYTKFQGIQYNGEDGAINLEKIKIKTQYNKPEYPLKTHTFFKKN